MKRFWALLCVLAVLVLPLRAIGAEGSDGLLYRITGGKSEMYLLGSIHLGTPDMYPLGQHILSALSSADTLVFESDTENPEAAALSLKLCTAGKDNPLRGRVSAQTYSLTEQAAQQLGYSMDYLSTLKPWAIVSLFSTQLNALQMGVQDITQAAAYGVDTQIRHLAPDQPRLFLEEIEDALLVMDDFSQELQEYLLQTTCLALSAPQSGAVSLYPVWWQSGDAQAFADSFLQENQNDPRQDLISEYVEKLLTRRNQKMADGLQALLQADEGHTYFATIGLMHLVLEDDSVLTLLQRMGYGIERIHRPS